MNKYYNSEASWLRFAEPQIKTFLLSIVFIGLAVIIKILVLFLQAIPSVSLQLYALNYFNAFNKLILYSVTTALLLFVVSLIITVRLSNANKLTHMIKRALFCFEYGNPLHLKDGELLPVVKVFQMDNGKFQIIITANNVTTEDISNVSSYISSGLKGKFKNYAITQTDIDVAFNEVRFEIEDVTIDHTLTFTSINDMKPSTHTKLAVQQGTYIDLTTSAHMIFCGKTRSGKSTGMISILLQCLLFGRDDFGSRITIIDPKRAELSMLPHTVSVTNDESGNADARAILDAVREFSDLMTKRQAILNELSTQKGDVVKWWEADLHVSILCIDEYVALRHILPKKGSKEEPEYCLATFDGLIKRIVTMGASAGCFVIISIAQASVDEGGLPSMLREAMSTKILFRPTLDEARLLWDSKLLKDLPERVYSAGDAWFSSTDGIHDKVSYVHFPIMDFTVYRALGELLRKYYE